MQGAQDLCRLEERQRSVESRQVVLTGATAHHDPFAGIVAKRSTRT